MKTTFTDFLLYEETESRTRSISEEEALKYLTENCSNYYSLLKNHRPVIYRGAPSSGDFLYGDPKARERRSKNTTNEYTFLIDNSAKWKEFPKRSRSWICTTSEDQAKKYAKKSGEFYVVIPFNNSNIGVCSKDDLWRSFTYGYNKSVKYFAGIKSIFDYMFASDFNSAVRNVMHEVWLLDEPSKNTEIGNYLDGDEREDYNSFAKALKKTSLVLDKIHEDKYERAVPDKLLRFTNKMKDNYRNFEHLLDDILSPGRNNFFTVNEEEIFDLGGDNREVWFDNKAIFVSKEGFKKLEIK